jgi:hypothetical protein
MEFLGCHSGGRACRRSRIPRSFCLLVAARAPSRLPPASSAGGPLDPASCQRSSALAEGEGGGRRRAAEGGGGKDAGAGEREGQRGHQGRSHILACVGANEPPQKKFNAYPHILALYAPLGPTSCTPTAQISQPIACNPIRSAHDGRLND